LGFVCSSSVEHGNKKAQGQGRCKHRVLKKTSWSARGIASPSIIYVNSIGAKTKEIIDAVVVFSSEEKSPQTPQANKLYHFVDVKSQILQLSKQH
jgi:hypothetical protein